jgi:hypothetical protein
MVAAACSLPHISAHFSKCLGVEVLPQRLRAASLFLERFEERLSKDGLPEIRDIAQRVKRNVQVVLADIFDADTAARVLKNATVIYMYNLLFGKVC